MVIVAALVVGGCSDRESATPTALSEGSATSSATSTSLSATGSAAVSTTQSPATEPRAIDPPVDPATLAQAALREAPIRDRKAYLYAVRNYDAPDALDRLAAAVVRDGPSWRAALLNMNALRENGWRVRPNSEALETVAVESVDLGAGPPYTEGVVIACEVGTSIVFEPGGAPDGSDTIVNDLIVARRDRSTYVVEDGVWKLKTGTNLGEWTGATACPPA